MTEIDVPDWVVEAAMRAEDKFYAEKNYGSFSDIQGDDAAEAMRVALTAALGAWVVPAACTEPWWIEYLSTYPRNTVEVWSMDTLSAGDVILYTLRQEKPE